MKKFIIVSSILIGVICGVKCSHADTIDADVNVRAFGAKGDGVTDDSAAFTAAGKAVWLRAKSQSRQWGNRNTRKPSGSLEGPRARIIIPKGRYLFKETACLHNDIVLVGEDGAELIGADSTKDILYLHGCFRVRVDNLTFRGGRHHIFAETLNRESANIQITRCSFYDSAALSFFSPSWKNAETKRAIGAWNFDQSTGDFTFNKDYESIKRIENNHSTMVVIDNCKFEKCEGAIYMHPDGSVIRNSSIVMPVGSTNAAIYAQNVLHAYGLKIVHSSGASAIRLKDRVILWFEDSSVTTADGSGARVIEGAAYNRSQVSEVILADIKTDAGLAKNNAICRFDGKFPAIAALVRVSAEGPNEVQGFEFAAPADEAAFKASNMINLWEPERFFSYGMRDCGANIAPIKDGYAKKFERPIPDWAASKGGSKCHLEAPRLAKPIHRTYPGSWHVATVTQEIKRDTIIDAKGVAAFVGLSSERPWFVVKKGATAIIRNLQVRGGKSFVVVEDGGTAYIEHCYSYDAEGPAFECHKGGRLVVDGGVYYAARLYEGEGDAFVRSAWYRFTEVVPPEVEIKEGAAVVNRGRLTMWDVLGVPTIFARYNKGFEAKEPKCKYDFRWIDNYGEYCSRMMRYGGEWGGLQAAWHYDGAKTLIEGSYNWYWNRWVPDAPVVCATKKADVKMFAVNFCLYRQFLKYIGLLHRNKEGVDVPCDSSNVQFTCPVAER